MKPNQPVDNPAALTFRCRWRYGPGSFCDIHVLKGVRFCDKHAVEDVARLAALKEAKLNA